MGQTPLSEAVALQDIFVNEWDYRFSREVVTFRQSSGSTQSYSIGLICEVSTGKYIPLATAANAAGVLLSQVTNLATATDLAVLMLVRGPVILNEDQLNANGQTLATALTALKALTPPIITAKQPTVRTDLAA